MVKTLDGAAFSRVVRAGALVVMQQQETLNHINVFPVPDSDTGANMAATLRAAAARVGSLSAADVGVAARAAADGALDGARGNSGAIFAQFLHGLAGGLQAVRQVDRQQFAAAARRGADAAYAALQQPREGTILSVLCAWSKELSRRAQEEDFGEMMRRGLEAARAALAETPRQLEVLARSRVVDAGGQGFVFFLEGIVEALRGDQDVVWAPEPAPARGLPPFGATHEEIDDRFRFCSEALLTRRAGRPLRRDEVAQALRELGESLVIAGGEDRLRVHLHTNDPRRFLAAVSELGVVERSKIDDMVLQQLGARQDAVALVTDSTTDMPGDEAFHLGVVAVPLTLTLGDETFLDGVDITLESFLERVGRSAAVPRSSQPAVADFAGTYRRLLEYREGIVSIHLASALSGTVQAAAAAAREVDPRRVRVVDSCGVSVSTGLVVEAVAEALAAGAGLDEAVAVAERVKKDVTVLCTMPSLESAVRGGRVGPRMAGTIERLGLAPIVVFDEQGKARKGGVALGYQRALHALVRRGAHFAGDAPARAVVTHSGDEAGAALVAARLGERLGIEVPTVRAGAVLTTHLGPGGVGLAVRRRAA
jgi:uncharacterized protein